MNTVSHPSALSAELHLQSVDRVTSKKRKPPKDLSNLGFDEALARIIQTNPSEVPDVHQRVAKEAGEIERDVKKHLKDIKTGGRSFKRPFRP